MCRMCLVENVRMLVVVNKKLHQLYERLTDNPFVTKDSRPMLACFFCCTKLKQCYRFLRTCLEAEELFAQMMNEDYERDPLINADHFGLTISPVMHISIVGAGQTVSVAIKEEFPDVCESNDIIETGEKHETDELELENVNSDYSEEDTPAHQSDEPVMEIKTEVEDEQEPIGPPDAEKIKLETQETKLEDAITDEEEKNRNNRKLSFAIKKFKKIQNSTSKTVIKFKEPFTSIKPKVTNSVHNTAKVISCRNNGTKNDLRCKISNKGIDNDDVNGQRKVSVEKKRFQCDICQHYCGTKSDLIKHYRIHTGEKRYKCQLCQRSFNTNTHLKSHIRTHTGEKRYKCQLCQRSFYNNTHLKNHIRTHTGEKPFKCDICQQSFSRKNNLISHIRVHTGEKPFKCDICRRSFNQSSHLTRHVRVHNSEKRFISSVH